METSSPCCAQHPHALLSCCLQLLPWHHPVLPLMLQPPFLSLLQACALQQQQQWGRRQARPQTQLLLPLLLGRLCAQLQDLTQHFL